MRKLIGKFFLIETIRTFCGDIPQPTAAHEWRHALIGLLK
jgi:hypothetical protein